MRHAKADCDRIEGGMFERQIHRVTFDETGLRHRVARNVQHRGREIEPCHGYAAADQAGTNIAMPVAQVQHTHPGGSSDGLCQLRNHYVRGPRETPGIGQRDRSIGPFALFQIGEGSRIGHRP